MVAINSAFILVISLVRLIAHGIRTDIELKVTIPLAAAVVIDSFFGATISEKKLSPQILQRAFAVIILIAAIKAAFNAVS